MKRQNIYANKIQAGMGIGIFTPSIPANVLYREKYLHGLKVISDLGFQVLEGDLTKSCSTEGYRTGGPKERADELMSLIRNPKVNALVAAIGGSNSSSLIPYLDFDEIRASQKVICGYSDMTSLHIAILHYSGLRTFYGPTVMPTFGEWPTILPESKDAFFSAATDAITRNRKLSPPTQWSNHFRDANSDDWKTTPRKLLPNSGWEVLASGATEGRILIANLSTLSANAGTPYFPDLNKKILLIETMRGTAASEERYLRQLERMGAFDVISGLIVGKIEDYKLSNEPFSHNELILEVVGSKRTYPIVSGFDCSHTNPILTLVEDSLISLKAQSRFDVEFKVLEPTVK